MHNQEIVRNRGGFRFRQGRMLFVRFGPANAQRQMHARRPLDLDTLEPKEWDEESRGPYADYIRRPPCSRGIWAFPYPFHDAFFYYHVFRRGLPKRHRPGGADTGSMGEAERAAFSEEHERLVRRERRAQGPRLIWWDGPLYSHLAPHPGPERAWHLYDTPGDWVDVARKHVVGFSNFDGGERLYGDATFRRYSVDHLEVFLPMHAGVSRAVRGR